jgi:hypothetical protein
MSGEILSPVDSMAPNAAATVLENPVSLNHALDVTPGAPRSSRADTTASHSVTTGSSRRPDGKVGIAIAGAIIGTTLFAAGMAEAQGNTNQDCASPSPSASLMLESPMPSPAAFSSSPDGSPTVTVSPSPAGTFEAPSSPFPSPNATGGVLPAVDGNGTTPEDCNEPTVKPTLSPEQIAKLVKEYSLKEFIKLQDKPITEEEFLQGLQDTNAATSAYMVKNVDSYYSPTTLLNEDTAAYHTYHKSWTMEFAGSRVITKALYLLKFAQGAAKLGDADTAAAIETRAENYVRLGKTFIKDATSSKFDTEMTRQAKELKIK